MKEAEELRLELEDTEWPPVTIDHDRTAVRAIVTDDRGYYYFVGLNWNDGSGKPPLIETAGGGVEPGEKLSDALRREMREELGAEVEILCKIGVVSDYYNVIRCHNITHFYLCLAKSFGPRHLTQVESETLHLETLRLTYEDALREYERCALDKLGRLLANRELPVLQRAREILAGSRP
ncbi:MAG: NUDIX hydrolase [Oscillospiraceae bacterium]|nr:NUDIX hydrolase [Oscillospiraceae bacterium]